MGVCLSKTYVVNYVISSSPSWQDMTWHGKLAGHGMASWQDMTWQAGRTWYGKLAGLGMASWHDMAWQADMTWYGKQDSGGFLALYFLWIQATSALCRSFYIGLDSSLRKDLFCVH